MRLFCLSIVLLGLAATSQGFNFHRIFQLFGWNVQSPEPTSNHPKDGSQYKYPNLLELASELKLTTCLDKLKQARVDRVINHEGWFTLFCPTNDAFQREKMYPGEDNAVDKMRMHVARGKYTSDDFQNEKKFSSLLSKRSVRMNVYNMGGRNVTTANGRAVVSQNHQARNGYVHVIDNVMSSVYQRAGSVISELNECCPQHSQLLEMVRQAGMYDMLDHAEPITLLAPLNKAWQELHPEFADRLQQDKQLLKQVLSAHVLPGTWYSAGLKNGEKIKSWVGDFLTVNIQQNGQIRFGSSMSTLTDVTAGNGAVHAIDRIIVPSNVRAQFNNIWKQNPHL